jgi:hypothetical protein
LFLVRCFVAGSFVGIFNTSVRLRRPLLRQPVEFTNNQVIMELRRRCARRPLQQYESSVIGDHHSHIALLSDSRGTSITTFKARAGCGGRDSYCAAFVPAWNSVEAPFSALNRLGLRQNLLYSPAQ